MNPPMGMVLEAHFAPDRELLVRAAKTLRETQTLPARTLTAWGVPQISPGPGLNDMDWPRKPL